MTDEQTPTPAEPTSTDSPADAPAPTDAPAATDAAAPTDVPAPPVETAPATPPPPVAPPADQATAATSAKPQSTYSWGTGRRKRSVARVRIRPGTGKFQVNKRKFDEYFRLKKDQNAVMAPLLAVEAAKRVDIFVNVFGGGVTGQAGAIVLGIARALCEHSADYVPSMRDGNYLTRDSRKVERKKPGQRGARRRFQFSKR